MVVFMQNIYINPVGLTQHLVLKICWSQRPNLAQLFLVLTQFSTSKYTINFSGYPTNGNLLPFILAQYLRLIFFWSQTSSLDQVVFVMTQFLTTRHISQGIHSMDIYSPWA